MTKCLLCNSDLSDVYFTAKDYITNVNGGFKYYQCSNCKSYIQNPIPSQDFLNECYKHQDLNYKKPQETSGTKAKKPHFFKQKSLQFLSKFESFLRKKYDKKFSNIIDLFPIKLRPAKILELGAAYGTHLKRLQKMGYEVTGVEPTTESCQQAKKLHNLDLINDIIENVHFKNGTFDIIIMSMVLEHVQNPKMIIEKCHKWLKKDGELLISIPTSDGFEFKKLKEYCYITQPPYHISLPTFNGVKSLIKNSFEIIDCKHQFTNDRDLCFSSEFQRREKPTLFNKFFSIGYTEQWTQILVRLYLIIGVNIFGLKTSRISIRMRKIN